MENEKHLLPSDLYGPIREDWENFKVITTNAKPSAGVAMAWIEGYVKEHPELDEQWKKDEIFAMISIEEEPSEWHGEEHPFVGKTVLIRNMAGEPQYSGRVGTVISVDDAGQIHGTWGGCALTSEDDFIFLDEDGTDPDHYNDGLIDCRAIREFDHIVFVNRDGESKTVCYDDNRFSAADLVAAYVSLWHDSWGEDREGFVDAFKIFLVASGCAAEELEGCDDE